MRRQLPVSPAERGAVLPRVHTVAALLFFALVLALPAHAQNALRASETLVAVPGDRLVGGPSRHGFLGMVREGELVRLNVYDDSLRQRAFLTSYGLAPVDAAWQPSIGRALLLAAPLGVPTLFSVPVDAPPEPALIWRGEGHPFSRIVATGDFDDDGTIEAALVGDSAFVIVRLDGTVRFRLERPMIDAGLVAADGSQFALVWRDGANAVVALFDARTNHSTRPISVPLTGPILTLLRSDGPPVLALASTRSGNGAWLVDLTRTIEPPPIPLASPPAALVPFDHEGRPMIAALVRAQHGPRLVPLSGDVEPVVVDYPLSLAFESVAISRDHIALVAPDSTAIYSRSWELLLTVASPGVEDPRLVELGSADLLLSTLSGSLRLRIDSSGPSWLERHWPMLLGGLVVLLALAAIGAMIARYSLVQSIYFNLVGVPSSYGVIVLSRTQRVTQMNGSARELLGVSTYIPLGRHIGEYLTRPELHGVIATMRRLFIEGEPFEQRLDIDSGERVRALNFRGRTMLTRAGFRAGYLLLVEDVTRTIAQERLVNWASVAHHIAHEMKTPLGTVRMTAEMLRDKLTTNGRDEDYLRATTRIIRQSERLREIVDDLLTVARTESLQKTRADLSLLLGSLAHDYREYLPPNVELDVVIQGEDHRCLVDVQQMSVALRNLLDNARHAIGGRDNGRISVTLAAQEREVMLTVEDNGIGMRPETLARLFQPFYSEREGGSGIGTVIIKRVFEAHGGGVEVTSTYGQGSRFVVRIPRE
jgi:signal transduction histidine kinase